MTTTVADPEPKKARSCDRCGAWTNKCVDYWDSVASFRWLCGRCLPIVEATEGPSRNRGIDTD